MSDNMKLNKSYHIKELSEDGLLKTPIRDGYGGMVSKYSTFGYKTPDEAYEAIKKEEMGKSPITGKQYICSGKFIVIEMVEWKLDHDR